MDSRGLLLLSFFVPFLFVLRSSVPLSDFRFELIQLRHFGLIEIKTETTLDNVNVNECKGNFC